MPLLRQGSHGALGAGQHHAVAGKDQWPLGCVQQRHRVAIISIAGQRLVERFDEVRLGRGPVDLAARLLRVLGDVDQHRTRASASRHGKRL